MSYATDYMNARLRDREKPTATAWSHRLFGTPVPDDLQPSTDTDSDTAA